MAIKERISPGVRSSKGKEFILISTSSARTAIKKINEDIQPILNIK